jgi:glyoxylase-like metal-dependent hydrolase (beta-lactamase superfamily II)
VLDDQSKAFTGDALLIRGCGRTDFQQAARRSSYRSVHEQILSLPERLPALPAHDYRGLTARASRRSGAHNPRLGGDVNEADFAGYMKHLGCRIPS